MELLLSPYDCDRYAQLTFNNDEWLKYMVQDIAKNHGYEFKYESVVDGFKKAIYQIYQSTNESEEKEDGKSK